MVIIIYEEGDSDRHHIMDNSVNLFYGYDMVCS